MIPIRGRKLANIDREIVGIDAGLVKLNDPH